MILRHFELGGVLLGCVGAMGCEAAPPPMGGTQNGRDAAVVFDAAVQADVSPSGDALAEIDTGAADVAQPYDGATIEKPGSDAACEAELGWWATNAAFDATITPSAFATALNPLLLNLNAHPFTIADFVDANLVWTLRASGTRTNGGYQQYFPYEYPSDTTSMSRTQPAFSSGAAATTWLLVIDASQTEVWIALVQSSVSASYVDAYCQALSGGELDAIVPASASGTSIVTSQGKTTLGALLGAPTTQKPAGWSVKLGFDGQKVDVSSK